MHKVSFEHAARSSRRIVTGNMPFGCRLSLGGKSQYTKPLIYINNRRVNAISLVVRILWYEYKVSGTNAASRLNH